MKKKTKDKMAPVVQIGAVDIHEKIEEAYGAIIIICEELEEKYGVDYRLISGILDDIKYGRLKTEFEEIE